MQTSFQRTRLFGVLLLMGLLVAIAVMLGMAELHQEIIEPASIQIDRSIQDMVHRHASPGLTRVMFVLTWIGSPIVLFPAIPLVAGIFWWKKMRDDALLLAIAMVGAGVMDFALKLHYRRLRPDVSWAFVHEHSFSFPSGHSVMAVVLYGTLVYLARRNLRSFGVWVGVILAALAVVAGIGLSRIYLGVHYPSDVLGGYFVGAVWLAAVVGADWWVGRGRARSKMA